MDDSDKRTVTVTVRLSPNEAAELDRRAGSTGTRSGTARDVLLEGLEVEDTARRPAPRRANYSQRQDKQQRGRK